MLLALLMTSALAADKPAFENKRLLAELERANPKAVTSQVVAYCVAYPEDCATREQMRAHFATNHRANSGVPGYVRGPASK